MQLLISVIPVSFLEKPIRNFSALRGPVTHRDGTVDGVTTSWIEDFESILDLPRRLLKILSRFQPCHNQ